ncbi:MAG: hypothetical protein KC438_00500 [Thermomicrobiales bacterium]|nr:hypothetical protein [Thermomicrobiales bacterium]MCO5220216.1 hypothetical protein [Thermomicrobiales bacterium]
MDRRSFLKATAASAGIAMVNGASGSAGATPGTRAGRRRGALAAQIPAGYELIDLYANVEQVVVGEQGYIGSVRDVANDGTAIGEVVENGILRAVTWDPAGTMNYLPLGPNEGTWSIGWVINSAGIAGGELRPPETAHAEGVQVDLDKTPLIWRNGVLQESAAEFLPVGTEIFRLGEDGWFTGSIGDAPARWTADGVVETMDVPAGFTSGTARARNATGDTAIVVYEAGPPFAGGVPGIWGVDGSVTLFDPPGGRAPGWAGVIRPVYLSDDGQLVIHAVDGESYFGQLYRYVDGVDQPIADAYGEGARLSDADTQGVVVGVSAYSGLTIPTMWIDDQPIVIADLIVPGPDRLLTNVSGINDDGAMVGYARDSAGITYSVLLRPV